MIIKQDIRTHMKDPKNAAVVDSIEKIIFNRMNNENPAVFDTNGLDITENFRRIYVYVEFENDIAWHKITLRYNLPISKDDLPTY